MLKVLKRFTEIHSRAPTMSSTLVFDKFVKLTVIFVIIFYKTVVRNSLDNNLLNVNNKKSYRATRTLL